MVSIRQTSIDKAYPKNVVSSRFCMYVGHKLGDEYVSLGEIRPDSVTPENSENTYNGSKSDIMYYADKEKYRITLKSLAFPPEVLDKMYKNAYDTREYPAGSISGSQTIEPECWSVDTDCPLNCIMLCDPFCEEPTINNVIHQVGKLPATNLTTSQYEILADDCGDAFLIRFTDPDLDEKGTITINYNGQVGNTHQTKPGPCDSPQPFVMKWVAQGACGGGKKHVLYFEHCVAKPMSMDVSSDGKIKNEYTIEIMAYKTMERTFL